MAGNDLHERHLATRGITVTKLRELLGTLQDADVIQPNTVGNLLVIRQGFMLAYIDMLDDRFAAVEYFNDNEGD